MNEEANFKFQFSLEVLNHLGRGLYRNFATVVAEAISNSWDAEAARVDITVDSARKEMTIRDDGVGMNRSDFQDRFLKVGYSRRDDPDNESRRKVLGRKGIGKLAMLSISEKVTVISKALGEEEIGGVIDNRDLDSKIASDGDYSLGVVADQDIFGASESGTYIKFESIKSTVNRPDTLRKYLAVLFNFSFSFENETFDIYLNGEKVTEQDLSELNGNTQFLWAIGLSNDIENSLNRRFSNISRPIENLGSIGFSHDGQEYPIKGYIASVLKPRNMKIQGVEDFKAGLHLFVNGRLRQEDIFRDIPSHRVVESYLYGEIHVDGLDEGKDIFTSNREGVVKDNPAYMRLLDELKKIQAQVFGNWDEWRASESRKKLVANPDIDLDGIIDSKKEAINKFLSYKEDDDWKGEFKNFVKSVLPPKSDVKILISHCRTDKIQADIIYQLLLFSGFGKEEILYTSSDESESRLPVGTDIFNYFREFFVQEWYDNPRVFFITSRNMEKSWLASLEAGAAWVTRTEHNIAKIKGYELKDPLARRHIYIEFDRENNCDQTDLYAIFVTLATKHGKGPVDKNSFLQRYKNLIEKQTTIKPHG